jgi:ubiquinone/menaquinone biosynthesis C-methylase UbiE
MALLAALSRRLHGGRVENEAEPPDPAYGANWVPQDETEAMDQILNVSDPEAFDAAGRPDAQKLAQYIGPTDTVLDLGCGIGRVTRYVAPLCREIWAVDASETMLGFARERLADVPNVRFLLGRGTSLPELESASIGFAYSLLTLQHIEREHAFILLHEVRRVLRDTGQAYLTFPNLLSDEYLRAFLRYVDVDEVGNPPRARIYTPQEVERLLPVAGLHLAPTTPYSTVVSKLSDENRILAQRLALLQNDLEAVKSDDRRGSSVDE